MSKGSVLIFIILLVYMGIIAVTWEGSSQQNSCWEEDLDDISGIDARDIDTVVVEDGYVSPAYTSTVSLESDIDTLSFTISTGGRKTV